MTTFLMIVCMLAVIAGGAIIGWIARAYANGMEIDLVESSGTGEPSQGG